MPLPEGSLSRVLRAFYNRVFVVLRGSSWCSIVLRLIVRYCDCGLARWWGQQEFAIPQNVLEIVYGQTICWIGTFYSPLLPAICTIKYFCIFYIKKVIAPPPHIYFSDMGQSQTCSF